MRKVGMLMLDPLCLRPDELARLTLWQVDVLIGMAAAHREQQYRKMRKRAERKAKGEDFGGKQAGRYVDVGGSDSCPRDRVAFIRWAHDNFGMVAEQAEALWLERVAGKEG